MRIVRLRVHEHSPADEELFCVGNDFSSGRNRSAAARHLRGPTKLAYRSGAWRPCRYASRHALRESPDDDLPKVPQDTLKRISVTLTEFYFLDLAHLANVRENGCSMMRPTRGNK